jgi:hypothetical protein
VGTFLAAAALLRASVRMGKARDACWAGWGCGLVAGPSGKHVRWMGRGSWATGKRRARGGGARGPGRESMALGQATECADAEGASRWAARACQVEQGDRSGPQAGLGKQACAWLLMLLARELGRGGRARWWAAGGGGHAGAWWARRPSGPGWGRGAS